MIVVDFKPTVTRYADGTPYLTNAEFAERLKAKLEQCTVTTLAQYIMDYIPSEIAEEYNTEIVTEWQADIDADA